MVKKSEAIKLVESGIAGMTKAIRELAEADKLLMKEDKQLILKEDMKQI